MFVRAVGEQDVYLACLLFFDTNGGEAALLKYCLWAGQVKRSWGTLDIASIGQPDWNNNRHNTRSHTNHGENDATPCMVVQQTRSTLVSPKTDLLAVLFCDRSASRWKCYKTTCVRVCFLIFSNCTLAG